ncbi:universal stress protein [Pseudoclavibacter sp. 8L]|uniref:universal stress protein n=1 Tax=Pseudoclavibacter sp. 8L TaxID=2653162 RepID=UPI0012F40F9B|nr:universal stress protein [Pseudoclavibacter sp. 8L]VXB10423.1 Universal stress protein [Pseudoclavibacter sp. 8L]
MAQRFVVGYIASDRGHDSLALASFLAKGTDTEIIIAMITPETSPYSGTHPLPLDDADSIIGKQIDTWMSEALAQVPEGIAARGVVRSATGEAQGLMDIAAEFGAAALVIGAATTALLRQFTIGTVASTLLHASPLPVALAPAGFAEEGPVTRITTLFGTRSGAAALIGTSVESALQRDVQLRLLSLVQLDRVPPSQVQEVDEFVREFGGAVLAGRAEALLESGKATVETVEGESLEAALERADWKPGDVAFVGSSRLAQGGRIFLGARAQRLLRVLTVPIIVVPRAAQPAEAPKSAPESPATGTGQ